MKRAGHNFSYDHALRLLYDCDPRNLRGLFLRKLEHDVRRRRDKELLKRWLIDPVTTAAALAAWRAVSAKPNLPSSA